MKIKTNCKNCDREIYLMPFKIKNDGNYCHSCICKIRWKEKLGNKPRQLDRVKIKCKDCGKDLEILYLSIKEEGNRCIRCSNIFNSKKDGRYNYSEETKKIIIEKAKKHHLPIGEASKNRAINSIQGSAKKRGFEYNLTREDFLKITSSNCFYCGSEPKNQCKSLNSNGKHGDNGDYIYNGIDRVDQNKGYILNNCVPCCKTCNWAKGTKTIKEFMSWIKQLINFQSKVIKEIRCL